MSNSSNLTCLSTRIIPKTCSWTIRTRITAVSLGKAATMGKIGITCRQPFLGADEWIKEELKKSDDATAESKGKDTKEKIVEVKEK